MMLLQPLFLLAYPLIADVLALLSEESKFTKILCTLVPLEKFKAFLDWPFRAYFRDDHRYFAGLYFVYRLSALFLFLISRNVKYRFYFVLELAFHSWVQPYLKKWHD